MPRTLIIGFGSIDRGDDGVAYHVINALRRRLGQTLLCEDETGLEELGKEIDSIFLVQLAPELMDVMAGYEQVVFVDAHVLENVDNLHCAPVLPEYAPATITHHMGPAMILALLKALYHREPTGHLVSIHGYDFDFHRNLSEISKALVEPAVEYILQSLIYDQEKLISSD
ncbi:MAG: hydrogenase maturation protease [Syntrophaceae bacterium]